MQNVLLQMAKKLNKSHKQRMWRKRLVNTLAMLVVFCTTYALILPAITMEAEPVCGLEVHEHTESCYVQKQMTTFACGLESNMAVVHTHSALCYDADGLLICPLAELELHTHLEECYGTERKLVCALEEVESHSHSEACTTVTQLVCQLPEEAGHSHGEGCYEQQLVCQIPEGEEHAHEAGCYSAVLTCQTPEAQGHAHGADCYVAEEVECPLPEIQGHTHEDSCFAEETVLTCGKQEVILHVHQADCYDAEGALICTMPQTVVHAHEESCVTVAEETVLECQLAEHVHTDACYPIVEEPELTSEYHCGNGIHTHTETCYDEAGELICTIPEHAHDVACLVKDYDPDADLETQQDWEQSVANVTLTGIWSEDVLAVAKSQLGYSESTRNVILVDEELKGYTRYGAKFSDPYGEWDAMFVAFCLEYAEITQEAIPYETDAADWVRLLAEKSLYADAQSYAPVPGDLVFADKDADAVADHVGILNEIKEDGKLEIITGNTDENMVGYATLADGILGYGILPQNPLTKEQYDAANALAAEIAALPAAQTVEEAFRSLNDQADKAGHEALRQELTARMDHIEKTYEGFNDLQKARVGTLDSLDALKELCGGLVWRQHPALTDDSAAVVGLTENGVTVIADPDREEEEGILPDNAIRSGDKVEYTFTVETESYYTDIHYGEAWVKVELVLPLTKEQAAFDLSAMTWLEEAQETVEIRTVNGQQVSCQILTGYKHLVAKEESDIVVSGSFTEVVSVELKELSHGDKLVLLISAAMEHGTWEGLCEEHQVEEKLTIATDPLMLYAPLSAQEQQAVFEEYLEKLEELEASEDLEEALAHMEAQITESYSTGALNEQQYSALYTRILELSGVDLDTVAEPSKGNGWIWMDFDVTDYTEEETILYSTVRSTIPRMSAMPAQLYSSLALDSNSQVDREGGENSKDDAIWVSKTIEGTEQENVFDITLQIITKEEVNEVYKEPDMAVVIVMDISNTMVSIFSGETTVTRYDAAMDSAAQFMQDFANKTDGISRLGYVAFNTHGHEVFPMQECSTTAQAKALATTMRTKTKSIMDTAASKATDKLYSKSHERFTNMEAGLAMAADMLDDATNRHKYIIFLSDGFPTTYLTASTTDGYTGYDPYTTSGSNGTNGVFYDAVMNVHCDYGTSYSDTAAIKARQMAVSLKNQGINIFSIGVDVEGQTIWEYHWDSNLRLKSASTVERRKEASTYNSSGYEIGTLHSAITKYTPDLLTRADGSKYIDQSGSACFGPQIYGPGLQGLAEGYRYHRYRLQLLLQ